jgi:putative DNA primase/helicase
MEVKRWQLCEREEEITVAKEVCAELYASAGAVLQTNPVQGRKLVADAVAAHNLPRIMAMLKLARSEPGMPVTERDLDADPLLLGVKNGVVDLKTGHLLWNHPDMLITRFCNAEFKEGADCTKWKTFLSDVFQGDSATIDALQRLLGYTLTGYSSEEILIICHGYGSNGKSVFANVIHQILGDYARTAPPSLLTVRRADDNSPRNDVAALTGARYVSINELQAGDRLDEQVVKMLAGREPISARFLHKEFFEFLPSFTPWLRTNHKPIITGEDDGIWRRLVLLPFARKFTEDEKDPHLEKKLLQERDGILMWMLEGCLNYLEDGLKQSPLMRAELLSYRSESDTLGEWLADETIQKPGARVLQADAYARWKEWAERNNLRPGSKKSFTQRLAERSFKEAKSDGKRYYSGLELRLEDWTRGLTQGGKGGK